MLPEFDSAFREPSRYFYFHHIVDPIAATLRVEVLGPNLTYTFRHERAKEVLSASCIAHRLERKTTGFLALVAEGGRRRIVLAWAESGHGAGRVGDLLDVGPGVLPNLEWTRKVIAMGKVLAMSMRRPFDGVASRAGPDMAGVFLGAHVEVKLAVHAVFVLLTIFKVTQDLDNVSRRHLRMLRRARWEDGTRPAFEIHFSRKNCGFCGSLVRELERITGVSIRLVWRERLVKVVYAKKTPRDGVRLQNRPRPQPQQQQQQGTADEGGGDNQAQDDDAEDDETLIADDVQPVDYVDLTRGRSRPLHNCRDHLSPAATINLIDEEEEEEEVVASPSPRLAAHRYIDGLAYCVGQIDQCPQGAQAAIIELAEIARRQRPPPRAAPPATRISKPLPATPETRPPGWMTPAAAGSKLPARAPPPRPGRVSICVELPSRRCSSPPDPF